MPSPRLARLPAPPPRHRLPYRTSNSPRHPFVTQITPYPLPQVLFAVHGIVPICRTSRTCPPTCIRHSARSAPLALADHPLRKPGPAPPTPAASHR